MRADWYGVARTWLRLARTWLVVGNGPMAVDCLLRADEARACARLWRAA